MGKSRSLLSFLCVLGVLCATLPLDRRAYAASTLPAAAAPVVSAGLAPAGQAEAPATTAGQAEALAAALAVGSASPGALDEPVVLPAPVPDPSQGYAGQQVRIEGQAPAVTPGIRIAWFYGDATRTAAVVEVSPLHRYEARITVPHDAPPGPAQICAAATGTDAAQFTCAGFTVTEAPPGEVIFNSPNAVLPATGTARPDLLLLNRAGEVIAQQTLVTTDTVHFPNVPVGIYQLAVTGQVGWTFDLAPVVVSPASQVEPVLHFMEPDSTDALTGEPCDSSLHVTQVSLTPSARRATTPELADAGLAAFPAVAATAPEFDFGVYAAGVALKGQLAAQTQASGFIIEDAPRYVLVSPTDPARKLSGVIRGGDHKFAGDLELGSAIFTAGVWSLYIYPRNLAGKEYCPTVKKVRFVDDPMKSPYFRQQNGQSATTWNGKTQRYEFKGVMPNFAGLPLRYPDPPPSLPVLGPMRNELEAGLFVTGSMGLDHTMTFTALDARAYAMAFNQNLYEKQFSIKPSWMQDVSYDPDNPESLMFSTDELSLTKVSWKTTVYKGVIASFWGVVTVNASVSIGINGAVVMKATVYPLKPAVDMVITPSVEPWVAVSIWVDLLLGLASAGADATASVFAGLPIHVNTQDSRVVYLGDPCMGVKVMLSVWARVNLYFYRKTWNLGEWKLVDYTSSGCSEARRKELEQRKPPPPPPPPRLLGTPVIAAGSNGLMYAALVADAEPNSLTPSPRVYVLRKKDGVWDDISRAQVLTDGSHMVQDPAIVVAGKQVLVAWTETMISPAEEEAAGNDMKQILKRQEIRYAYQPQPYVDWRTWQGPFSLTSDSVADGRPVLAGNPLGSGATLAWVRSGDERYERSGTQIAVTEWDAAANPTTVTWGARAIFDADGMEAQPSVSRINDIKNPRYDNLRALAFVTNADGDTSGRQRRLRLYLSTEDGPNAVWRELDTARLPNGAMSPAVSVDIGTEVTGVFWLAFLVGSPGAPGSPVDPAARLYLSRWNKNGLLDMRETLDWSRECNAGDPIFAEKPVLVLDQKYRTAVIFRRFGAAGTNGALGQIAMLKTNPIADGCKWQLAPQYLTDENRPNWLPTAGIDDNGAISVLWLRRSERSASTADLAALARLAPASTAPLPAAAVQTLTNDEDPVQALTLENNADPALDPQLLFEPAHATVDTSVVITATVRNMGLTDTQGMTVELYRGTPDSGALVQTQPVSGTLVFGQTQPVAFTVKAGTLPEPYYAVVTPGAEGDAGVVNNAAAGTLNALEPPTILGIVTSPRFRQAAELSWTDDDNPVVAGYRIVRAESSSGPYELVGLAREPSYADLGLRQGVIYYYKVQSYDGQGHVSAYSLPVAAALPQSHTYLPAIGR